LPNIPPAPHRNGGIAGAEPIDTIGLWTLLQAFDAPLAACIGLAAILVARQQPSAASQALALAALLTAALLEAHKLL